MVLQAAASMLQVALSFWLRSRNKTQCINFYNKRVSPGAELKNVGCRNWLIFTIFMLDTSPPVTMVTLFPSYWHYCF